MKTKPVKYVDQNGTPHNCINEVKTKDCPACVDWIRETPNFFNRQPIFIKQNKK